MDALDTRGCEHGADGLFWGARAAGTVSGDVLLYTLSSRECLLELSCASELLTESVAVNRIVWGPEGNCFGALTLRSMQIWFETMQYCHCRELCGHGNLSLSIRKCYDTST